MEQVLQIPARMRIDNAANIYPASLSKRYASLYRMSVTLCEPVDTNCLQQALETVSLRIPTFRCGLRSGAFWWHLRRLRKTPLVRSLVPLNQVHFMDNGGFLYRVSPDGCRIVLDVFHALADGGGAQVFLLTLTGEYLRLRYGITISYGGKVWDPACEPSPEEIEDSFKTIFSGRSGELEKNDRAYHLKGKKLPFAGLRDVRVVMSLPEVKETCRKLDCSVTDLLTSLMLQALQEVHGRDDGKRKADVLKVSVPVDLRPMYGCRTVRNFSSYVNLGFDAGEKGYHSLPELVRKIQKQKGEMLALRNLEPKIAANVELEENIAVRCLPLFIKRPVIDLINRHHGDVYCSHTLSNLGLVQLPQSMRPYVKEMDFVLGRQRGNSGAASCVGYDGKLFLHFSRKITGDEFERCFRKRLAALEIPFETADHILA